MTHPPRRWRRGGALARLIRRFGRLLLLLLFLRSFERGPFGTQRRVRVSAATTPALRAIRWNSRTGSFRWPSTDGGTDDLREAGDALILFSLKSLRANLDAVNEGAMVVG